MAERGTSIFKENWGIPSGPSADRTFSLLIMCIFKAGEKIILEMPGSVMQGGMHGNLKLSVMN